ncbi:MAG: cytochrome c [Nitrospira sp.]|nr:cytochrome c [Nitrospira sp.]
MGKAMFKLVIGLVVGGGLWFTAKAMGFPPVFQWAFFSYAAAGTVVFLLLDIPSMKPQSGWGAALSVLLFFGLLCVGYVAGASLLPQFDPEDEKGKNAKVLSSAKSGNPLDPWKADEVIQRAKELDQKVKELEARIKALGSGSTPVAQPGGAAPVTASVPAPGGASGGDILKVGEEQWQLQECYNCHKLRGDGGKKRGPELDNIGTHLTVDQIKQKIMDPKSYMATGFEKEWEKGRMPDKFKDVMSDGEITALATWLNTFKNTAVDTPIPIKKK